MQALACAAWPGHAGHRSRACVFTRVPGHQLHALAPRHVPTLCPVACGGRLRNWSGLKVCAASPPSVFLVLLGPQTVNTDCGPGCKRVPRLSSYFSEHFLSLCFSSSSKYGCMRRAARRARAWWVWRGAMAAAAPSSTRDCPSHLLFDAQTVDSFPTASWMYNGVFYYHFFYLFCFGILLLLITCLTACSHGGSCAPASLALTPLRWVGVHLPHAPVNQSGCASVGRGKFDDAICDGDPYAMAALLPFLQALHGL